MPMSELKKYFVFSPFSAMLAIDLWYITFIILRFDPSIPNFFGAYIMKGCWILSVTFFFASFEIIMWFFPMLLFIWCILFIGLHMLNYTCIPVITATWLWYMFLIMCYFSVVEFSLQIFHGGFLHSRSSEKLFYRFFLCPYAVLVSR
jgi:hypothetical protein